MDRKNELENRLKLIDLECCKLYDELIHESDSAKVRSVYAKINELKKEYYNILNELECMRKADYTDGKLDLLVSNTRSKGIDEVYYNIRFTNTPIYIGEIRVTYVNPIKFYGNIGYELKPTYRGNGYMLKALNILKKPLIENGLTKPIFTVFPNNIASVKTITGFGGKLIEREDYYDIYEANLEDDNKIK